ncbi:MAG: MCE family protein [Bacteroidetes bacterium HGW-Bacteroidetes-3]|nr:MAG: MCE family protein [Bacteroidetes bacterium HGW-Bacteroidetes-3]
MTRELKTGIVAVAIIALFIWGYNYLKGLNLFDAPSKTYFTEYKDVQGLNTSSIVSLNGVEVGKIIAVKFNKDAAKRGWLTVEFSVETDLEFSKNSIAKIYSTSLMGGKSLALVPSFEGEIAKPGDFLQGETEADVITSVSENLKPLFKKVESAVVSADSVLVGLNEIMDAKTRADLKSTIAQLNATMLNFNAISKSVNEMVATNKEKLGNTLTNAELMTSNFAKLSDTLANSNLGTTVKNLETTVNNLNSILANVESGEGTLGKLLKDEAMYNNLTSATKELDELLREMKLHPKRFVHFSLFGKKEKAYVPETKKE